MTSSSRWEFYIDRGGTFTDIVAKTPQNKIIVHKLLSENPEHYQDAPIQGIRDVMDLSENEPIPTDKIEVVKMGTTVATNALLESQNPTTESDYRQRVVLLINQGFRDALRIGYQNRPDIFAREIILPRMLYESVIEIDARYDAQGNELKSVDEFQVKQDLQAIFDQGISSCAVVLMHSYRYPEHELQIGKIAREVGFTQISISHQVSSLMKLVSRGDTTVVDAYLTPILRRYVERIASQLPQTNLMFMKSDGGLVAAENFQGKDSILSGPAGGIIGAVQTSKRAGYEQIITFDMGGTSTDVAHFAGEYERELELEIAGARMRVPVLAIHTIAAGGGSLLHFDGMSYGVGPESGGSDPGPACYRLGGDLTITDANVMVGKIQPQYFPRVFGRDGQQYLDQKVVVAKFKQLALEVAKTTGIESSPEQVAAGFIAIAVANMANAIKKISLQRGYDVSNYVLCCFGGAGAQVACLVADVLGMSKILIHPYAGVLSAYGIGLADIRQTRVESVEEILNDELMPQLKFQVHALGEVDRGQDSSAMEVIRKVNLKYTGSNSTLMVDFNADLSVMKEDFQREYQNRYGFLQPEMDLVVESIAVELVQRMDTPVEEVIKRDRPENQLPDSLAIIDMFAGNQWHQAKVYERKDLQPGDCIQGAAMIVESISTIIIEPNWQASVSDRNYLILERI